jgi:Flp pilus assembly protein TadG
MTSSKNRFAFLKMRRLRGFARADQGATAVEFALVLPIVLLIMLGCFEVPRFVMVYQKISRTSASVADLVAQADEPITGDQLHDIFAAAKLLMEPYDVVANGSIYVSSINNPSGGPGVARVTWQKNNDGAVAPGSRIGNEGAAPALPAGLSPITNEEVLAAEVFFNYTPVFANLIYNGTQLYRVSYTRPRNKNLMTKPGNPTCGDPTAPTACK